MHAACDQYSKLRPADQYASSTVQPADGAEACVRDQFVRAGQHRDRVELYGTEVPQHARHSGAAVRRAEEALGAQGDSAGLVGGEFGGGRWHWRHVSHPRGRH